MTHLIDENDLRNECGLAQISNDDKRYKVHLHIRAAHRKLEKTICYDFYNELITQFDSNTLTAENELFLERAKPYLCWLAYSRYAATSHIFDTDAGLSTYLGEDSEIADVSAVNSVVKMAEAEAMYYEVDMLNFLVDNIIDYPTYDASDCNECNDDKDSAYSFSISGAGSSKSRPFKRY